MMRTRRYRPEILIKTLSLPVVETRDMPQPVLENARGADGSES